MTFSLSDFLDFSVFIPAGIREQLTSLRIGEIDARLFLCLRCMPALRYLGTRISLNYIEDFMKSVPNTERLDLRIFTCAKTDIEEPILSALSNLSLLSHLVLFVFPTHFEVSEKSIEQLANVVSTLQYVGTSYAKYKIHHGADAKYVNYETGRHNANELMLDTWLALEEWVPC
ncbi:hypothetical protein M422DRAFT_254938 [Sphaerobolus stellatus SS14]|uniref:Uncharacterized protein n=1 Tax=Sphaerobolus stellatus (strain SS14) TaxID=990650 RepID=A0A0C9UG11_SPHS4|nr:hypothetical protein M422DRAFT_254938 [Sphaerobolus stellatus SS14]